jgi:DNA-binding SARP family transcriptional activator
MPPLALTLCGPVTLLDADGGDHGAGLGAKALGLLAYLALEPRSHPRDVVTALLWGEYPEERARASLRQALSQLRHVFAGRLDADRASVALDPGRRRDRRGRAAPRGGPGRRRGGDARGRGALPRRAPVRHCDAFDEWAAATRASLARAAARRARRRRRRRDGAPPTGARRSPLPTDGALLAPLDDAAARAAVEARFLSGDGPGARALLAEHAARTREAAGREPDRALRALAERMERETRRRRTRHARARRHADRRRRRGAARPALRADASGSALRDAWGRLATGAGHVVVLEGELGAGRRASPATSRVVRGAARERAARARPRGAARRSLRRARAARARALDAPDVAAVDGAWLSELSRVAPRCASASRACPSPRPPRRTPRACTRRRPTCSSPSPPTGRSWSSWTTRVAGRGERRVVRVSSRARPTRPCSGCSRSPTAGRARRPGRALARAARALPHAATARLARLGRADVRALVADALGRDDAEAHALADRVLDDTAGTPGWVALHLDALRAWRAAGRGRAAAAPRSPTFGVAAHPAVRGPDPRARPRRSARTSAPCSPRSRSRTRRATPTSSRTCTGCRACARRPWAALVEAGLAPRTRGAFACTHPVVARVVRDAPGTALQREVHRALAYTLAAPERLRGSTRAALAGAPRPAWRATRPAGGEPAMAFHHAAAAVEGRAQCDDAAHDAARRGDRLGRHRAPSRREPRRGAPARALEQAVAARHVPAYPARPVVPRVPPCRDTRARRGARRSRQRAAAVVKRKG